MSNFKDFLDKLETICINPMISQQFYNYIKIKSNIPYETGMLFIEKLTMENVLENLK